MKCISCGCTLENSKVCLACGIRAPETDDHSKNQAISYKSKKNDKKRHLAW